MLAASQMLIDLFLLESTTQQKLMEEEHRMKPNSSPPPPWLQDSCTIQFLNCTTSSWGGGRIQCSREDYLHFQYSMGSQ